MSDSDNSTPFPRQSKTAFVKTEKAYVRTKEAKVVKEKDPPRRTDIKIPLTKEQRKYLNDLMTELVTTSNLAKKPISYQKAWTLLYDNGLDGAVNHIEQIEQNEFEQCISYIQQRIRALESTGNKRVIRRKSDYRNSRISAMHARCKELCVPDEIRKDYQLSRFKKRSMKDFTDDELDEYYNYVMHGTPKFTLPRTQTQSIQQDRENALRVHVGFMEANAKDKGQIFNPHRLNYSKLDMFETLKQRDKTLFGDMSEEQFNKFWSKQQICKLKPGKPLGSGQQ